MTMKRLCRIRLINWHYFANETINVSGSFLISGENTAGKSTILDAIQLVLTTNTRKFNTAANEKSNRNLKGYVRCKTGSENSAYMRKGGVITYVALEFFEEKKGKYFTLGAMVESPDEESKLTTRWFREECKLEDLTFITNERPSTREQFRKNNRKVQLISQIYEAKERFRQRMGNLEDRFFDMIPKSLAFKPMDNVKDFINKFILAEKNIEVVTLRNNIENLKEMEELMESTKAKLVQLQSIINKSEEIELKDRDIGINEILIKKAEMENRKKEIEIIEGEIEKLEQRINNENRKDNELEILLKNEWERLTNIKVSIEKNETAQLIKDTQHRIEGFNKDMVYAEKRVARLKKEQKNVIHALEALSKLEIVIMKRNDVEKLMMPDVNIEEKGSIIDVLTNGIKERIEKFNSNYYKIRGWLEEWDEKKIELERDIKNLRNKKLNYPENTVKLKTAIEREFVKQGIVGEVRIFSDLLEVTDGKWQNAVEGYLNTQRFYIIVDPQNYRIALEVYNKIKKEVHTVGLVNTGKLNMDVEIDRDSLAYVVKSDNRYARAYAAYLLNRVIRCEDINSLKDHNVAITDECMLYQNYAVRKIKEKVYRTPYIGAFAYEIQLKNKEFEYEELKNKIKEEKENKKKYKGILDKLTVCNTENIKENLDSPVKIEALKNYIKREEIELKKAQNNPGYIELQIQVEECEKSVKDIKKEQGEVLSNIGKIENEKENKVVSLEGKKNNLHFIEEDFERLSNKDAEITAMGLKKYAEEIKIKSPGVIVQNFSPRRAGLLNKRAGYCNELVRLQADYGREYDCDLGIGYDQMEEYNLENHKLVSSEIIKYEEQLKRAKENCEMEFRESFLAALKENIENAQSEFKQLNRSLKGIYYGEDSYKFEITHSKNKESLYNMIMSKNNLGDFNLFSGYFEDEYREEMEELFSKLTAHDDKGEKVLKEYTDYRGYLDYDIVVEKKDGTRQRFSKIYGEKSGGETQTPYYVAIAASFLQLYKLGDTIRIIMLDEAFDKMDDNRIASMMDFFNSQNFQIILATPPAKMEVVGEKVDTILMAMREGSNSIIEEYDL